MTLTQHSYQRAFQSLLGLAASFVDEIERANREAEAPILWDEGGAEEATMAALDRLCYYGPLNPGPGQQRLFRELVVRAIPYRAVQR